MVRDRQPGKAGFKSILPEDIEPEDLIYTVISGVFYIGLAIDSRQRTSRHIHPALSFCPVDTWHFHRAKSGG
jgi:hypothetical protein